MIVSFIMQSYLDDYPGSRSNPVQKFHRMVNCFINQTNDNWELVIVSDGCEITMNEYESHYASNPKIKFAYVAKPKNSLMYAEETGQKYFRGLPRQVGIEISTGDWISYVDSDDFVLPNTVDMMITEIEKRIQPSYPGDEVRAILNRSSIKNIVLKKHIQHLLDKGMSDAPIDEPYKIEGLDSLWQTYTFAKGKANLATVSVIHRKDWPPHNWKDSIGDRSEDMLFINPMTVMPLAKHSDIMDIPYYVICHYSNKWDH
jgi:glycosyltransferase involved in cell wall biosynthesis